MVKAVATSQQSVLSSWTEEQLALIKSTIAVGATDDELKLYLQTCLRTNLDPFMRQIYFVKRAGKMSIQVSIDGFRATAARTGCYAGNADPLFDNEELPRKATVTVYRMVDGQRCPFEATARWSQYFPGEKQGFMWNKMPHLMLGKCAEALALRKAFPEALSGLYSEEEMQQAAAPEKTEVEVLDKPEKPDWDFDTGEAAAASRPAELPKSKMASAQQVIRMSELCRDLKMDLTKDIYDKMKIKGQPNEEQAAAIIVRLEQKKIEAEKETVSTESK